MQHFQTNNKTYIIIAFQWSLCFCPHLLSTEGLIQIYYVNTQSNYVYIFE